MIKHVTYVKKIKTSISHGLVLKKAKTDFKNISMFSHIFWSFSKNSVNRQFKKVVFFCFSP